MRTPIFLVFVGLNFFGSLSAWAAVPKKLNQPSPRPTLFKRTTDYLAETVDAAADKIDVTLAGRRYTKEPNQSRAVLSQIVTWQEGGRIRTSTDFAVNLRLSNLERRWQLRFSSYDEEEESRNFTQSRFRTSSREKNYEAALQFFKKLGHVKVSFIPKVAFKDPLEVSHVLRFESPIDGQGYRLTPRFDLFADPVKGTGEFFSVDLSIPLGERFSLNFHTDEEYREQGNLFGVTHGLSLGHDLTDDSGIEVNTAYSFISRPAYHLQSFTYAISYGKEFMKDRLKMSTGPFIGFSKDRGFKGEAGANAGLTLTL